MATPAIDSLVELIKKRVKIGADIYAANNADAATASAIPYIDSGSKLAATTVTASKPVYIDSSSVPQTGALPFANPLSAGATDSSFSTWTITGRATGSADELMHLNLVKGANATSTIAGFVRTTITDQAGVITDGDYYVPFYTLA